MTIEEIFHSEDISVRSFNVCNDNDLNDLSKILNHYLEHRTFVNLRNCGSKSNKELIELCLKYNGHNNNNNLGGTEKQLISIIKDLTRTQREIVNSFIEINKNNLSNRSKTP